LQKGIEVSYKEARKQYEQNELNVNGCPSKPHLLLDEWIHAAHQGLDDANAMVLSTVSKSGQPSSRVVLLRELHEEGIIFYTNYLSQKAEEMDINRHVSLNFFWPSFERQVRVQGLVSKISEEQSDQYFNSRPRESQIGAWASQQSQPITDRVELDAKVLQIESKFKGIPVTRPKFWGGFLVEPSYFEFWQGRPNRLHDRIAYRKNMEDWIITRLSP
jgi:pyridoxamine 5'-phosphate oxidase